MRGSIVNKSTFLFCSIDVPIVTLNIDERRRIDFMEFFSK